MEGHGGRPPRAGSLNELVFAARGIDFSLALEARLPEDIQARVVEGMLARMRSEEAVFQALLGAPAAREAMMAFLQKRKPDFSSIT